MVIAFALFGLGIAFFQTVILITLWGVNLKPKWILFLITPMIVSLGFLVFDEDTGMIIFFSTFCSVFVLGISGMIYRSIMGDEKPRTKKSKKSNLISDPYPKPLYLNPIWGIFYEVYVITIIVLHIFVPEQSFGTKFSFDQLINDLFFQIYSIIFFTVISIILLLMDKLKHAKIYLPTIYSTRKLVETEKEKKVNTSISIGIGIILTIVFLSYCYAKEYFDSFLQFTQNTTFQFFNINTGILAFILFNLIILILNPLEVAKNNIFRISMMFRNAYFGIFMAAACVPVFLIIESKMDYFNMSSEIVLFLGFNLVMLLTEILLWVKRRREKMN